jgi:hypothetical protein
MYALASKILKLIFMCNIGNKLSTDGLYLE